MNTNIFSNLFFCCRKTETSASNFLIKSTHGKAKRAQLRPRSIPLQECGPGTSRICIAYSVRNWWRGAAISALRSRSPSLRVIPMDA